jgi:hypothetical protein
VNAAQNIAHLIEAASAQRNCLRLTCENTGFQVEIECGNTLTIVLCMWDDGDAVIFFDGAGVIPGSEGKMWAW